MQYNYVLEVAHAVIKTCVGFYAVTFADRLPKTRGK